MLVAPFGKEETFLAARPPLIVRRIGKAREVG
jgi:hypothetical protein